MLSLIGTDDSEISDDVVQSVLTLMQAHNTQQLNIGFYTPAEIMLMTSQPGYIHMLNRSIPKNSSSILIHPLRGHWVTSYYDANSEQVTVYDSLLTDSHCAEVKNQIKIIYGEEMASNIKYGNVTQQNFLPVCGVLAIAFATSLYFGKDPETVKYDILEARDHLRSCLASGLIQPFPSEQSQTKLSQNQTSQTESHQEDSLLDSYFLDQRRRGESRKRLLSDHDVVIDSGIPIKRVRTSTSNSSTDRKIRSRQNPIVHEREKQSDRQRKHFQRQDKHKKNEENRKQREYAQKRRHDKEIRNSERQGDKDYRQKRRQNEEIRKCERQGEKHYRQKRRQSEEIRKSERQGDKDYRQKRRQNEEIRKCERQGEKHYRQKRRQNEEIRKCERQGEKHYRQKRRQNEEIRKSERQGEKHYRQKRRQSEEIRKSERQGDKDYRQKRRQNEEIRKCERQGEKHYRQNRRKHEDIRNMESRSRKHNIELKRSQIDSVILQFKENCKQMPTFVCAICYRQLFKKQVKTFTFSKYDDSECVSECLTANKLHQYRPNCTENCSGCARWICFTCDRYLLQNKLPNQASVNSLAVPIQPPCLANLNTIEKHLITPVIPFMKIIPLPKGQQKGLHGPVVCVPSNLSSVTEVLPRQLSDDTLVKVKLKRKLEYKGHHLFQQVSLQKLKNALDYLKAYNPYYKGNFIAIILRKFFIL
ncbi:MAG: DUF6570 domain-containing protein [Candidatus Thiodiazotropha sp.]